MAPIPRILHKTKYRSVIHLAPPKGGIDRGRPVFKLTYEESTQVVYHFVLKAEFTPGRAGASQSGDFAYGMMREVARGTEARMLDQQESKWAWEHLSAQRDPGLSAYIANMAPTVNEYTWLVMKCKDGLEDLGDVTENGDVQKAIAMLTALKDPENQERLGAMLTCGPAPC